MSLPATVYDTATITNPSATLTDFPILVDLSNMSAEWWAAVDTTDGTKGRAAKDDGTELPCDWIDFDQGAKTGYLRVKWSGIMSDTGTQVLRVYPPTSTNLSVAANAVYGSDNVYDSSTEFYVPIVGSTYLDRTVNGIDAIAENTDIALIAGQVGDGVRLNATTRASALNFGLNRPSETAFTLSSWVYWDGPTSTAEDNLWGSWGSNAILIRVADNTNQLEVFVQGLTATLFTGCTFTAATWTKIDVTYDGTDVRVYKDGVEITSNTMSGTAAFGGAPFSEFWWGGTPHAGSDGWRGRLDEGWHHNVARSAEWIEQEFTQTKNNTTFFSTWANQPAVEPPTVQPPYTGAQPFAALVHGNATPDPSVPGHTIWTWDEPYTTNPNIVKMREHQITMNDTTRWKADLPGMSGGTVTTASRVAEFSTGPATGISLPAREAQEVAKSCIDDGLLPNQIGIVLNRFGAQTKDNTPHLNQLFQHPLDAPTGIFSNDALPVITNINSGQVPIFTPALPTTNSIDSIWTENGVAAWSGYMSAFCAEWKRLQQEEPYCVGLPDPTAFWFDIEEQNEILNLIKRSSLMQVDVEGRWDQVGPIVGVGYSAKQIYQEIRDNLEPSQRLPEVGNTHLTDPVMGTIADTTGFLNSAWWNEFPEWSTLFGTWLHRIEASAVKAICDNEVLPYFPNAYIGNWDSSSAHGEEQQGLTWSRKDHQGTHGSHVNYSTPRDRTERYCLSDTTKPQAPWVYYPLQWGADGNLTQATVNNWSLAGETQLPDDLKEKYSAELAAVAADVEAENLLLSEIYWRESMTIFRDQGVRHFLCWWNPAAEAGISTAGVGTMMDELFEELFSALPTVPLAKYLNPNITRLASAVPAWKLSNGIKSWTLRMASTGRCILKINRSTYIGTYKTVEHALQIVVGLHIRLGASASSENQQETLRALINSKYVNQTG